MFTLYTTDNLLAEMYHQPFTEQTVSLLKTARSLHEVLKDPHYEMVPRLMVPMPDSQPCLQGCQSRISYSHDQLIHAPAAMPPHRDGLHPHTVT